MDIKIEMEYDWLSVLKNDGLEYYYPESHKLVQTIYQRPAIYRWSITKDKQRDIKIMYIGET